MIVILLYEDKKIQISVNPELPIDRFLHEEAEEFFGFTWVLAQQAKAKGKDPEEDLEERRANGAWETTIKNALGITYEIKEDMDMPESELEKYKQLGDDEVRVFKYITKNKGQVEEMVLDGSRTLLSYSIMGKPTIRVSVDKKPKTLKIWKKGDSTIVAEDEETGEEHTIHVDNKDKFTLKDVKERLRKSLTSAAVGKQISADFKVELPDGKRLQAEDDKVTIQEAAEQLDHAAADMAIAKTKTIEERKQLAKQKTKHEVHMRRSETKRMLQKRHTQVMEAAAWLDKPTVFQIGAYTCKAGYAGDMKPRVVEPAIRGKPRDTMNFCMIGVERHQEPPVCSDVWEAKMFTGVYCLLADTPDWTSLERIWSHIFYTKLAHRPENSPVLVTIPMLAAETFKQALTRSLFDNLGFCGIYFVVRSICPLRSMGIDTGLVVDIGFNNTFITPVVNRTYMPGLVQRLMSHQNREERIGGHHMVMELVQSMREQGISGVGENGDARKLRDTIQVFQENCYVAIDPEAEEESGNCKEKDIQFENAEGPSVFKLHHEQWQIPELLFEAKTAGKKTSTGLDAVIAEGIRSCDVDLRQELWENVVLAGGLAHLKGLKERLEKEIPGRAPKAKFKIQVCGKHGHFYGASCIAHDMKMEAWIHAEEYEEHGPSITRRKCLNA